MARQFHNPLIYVLLAAAAITLGLRDYLDAGVIVGVVIINAIIGFVQEGRAEQALEAVRSLLANRATVVRDGERHEIDAAELVPGDLVLLESGDRVPADLRLLQIRDLHIDEAALTGESVPVAKQVDPVAARAAIGDRLDLAHAGTVVSRGQGRGIAVIGLQLLFTYTPLAQRLFQVAPLDALSWLVILAAALGIFFAVAAEKWLLGHREGRAPELR